MERMGLSREDNDGTAGGAGEDTSSSNGGETPHRVRHAARREFEAHSHLLNDVA